MRRGRLLSTLRDVVAPLAPPAIIQPSSFTTREAWSASRSPEAPHDEDLQMFWLAGAPFHPFCAPTIDGESVRAVASSPTPYAKKRRRLDLGGRRRASMHGPSARREPPPSIDRLPDWLEPTPSRALDGISRRLTHTAVASTSTEPSAEDLQQRAVEEARRRLEAFDFDWSRIAIPDQEAEDMLEAMTRDWNLVRAEPQSRRSILSNAEALLRAAELNPETSFVDRAVNLLRDMLTSHGDLYTGANLEDQRRLGAVWLQVLSVRRTLDDIATNRTERALDAVFGGEPSASHDDAPTLIERRVQAQALQRLFARWEVNRSADGAAEMSLNLVARYWPSLSSLLTLPTVTADRLRDASAGRSVDVRALLRDYGELVAELVPPLHAWLDARLASLTIDDVAHARRLAQAAALALGARHESLSALLDMIRAHLPDWIEPAAISDGVEPTTRPRIELRTLPILSDEAGVESGEAAEDALSLRSTTTVVRTGRKAANEQDALKDALQATVEVGYKKRIRAAALASEAERRHSSRPVVEALRSLHSTAIASNRFEGENEELHKRVSEAYLRIQDASENEDRIGIINALFSVVPRQRPEPHTRSLAVDGTLIDHAITALVHIDSLRDVDDLLDRLEHDYDKRPSRYPFLKAMAAYARHGNHKAVFGFARRLKRMKLDHSTAYQSLTSLATSYARTAQADKCRLVIDEMENLGLKVDIFPFTSLMQAHLANRALDEVANVFNRVRDIHRQRLQDGDYVGAQAIKPDQRTVQVLATAAVLAGRPLDQIFVLYEHLLGRKFKPNGADYMTFLKSAWRDNQPQLADQVFGKIDALPRGPDLNHYTAMINGYIRSSALAATPAERDQRIASSKELYALMVGRGIKPDAVLALTIVRGYASGAFGVAAIDTASRIARQAFESMRPSELQQPAPSQTALMLIASVAAALARRHRHTDALQMLQFVQDKYPKPNVFLLSALLAVYRRMDDVDAVLGVYDRLFNAAQALQDTTMSVEEVRQSIRENYALPPHVKETQMTTIRGEDSRRSLLHWSHTQLMDILVQQGRFSEIAPIWTRAREAGYSFSPDNFNALAVAFIKSHQLELACWIIEHVLADQGGQPGDGIKAWKQAGGHDFDPEFPSSLRDDATKFGGKLSGSHGQLEWSQASAAQLADKARSSESERRAAQDDDQVETIVRDVLNTYERLKTSQWFAHRRTLIALDRHLPASDEARKDWRSRWPKTFAILDRFVRIQRDYSVST